MLRNRVNRVVLTIGVGAAVCALPVALAAARAPGGTRVPAVLAAAQPRGTVSAGTAAAMAGGGGISAVPEILFPIPTQGPPRQFPLPGPTTKPPPPPTTPPARPTPPPPRAKPAPEAVPKPVIAKPKPAPKPPPKPKPEPPPKPAPKPAPVVLPLPPRQYHAVPQHHLTTVLIVFLVAIVPVSLARVRR